MPYIAVAEDNSAPIDLYYEDHGAGPTVVLVHGFPTSSRSWEKQVVALYRAGFRAVTYDRRGFGRSSMPAFGYDFDTLAADLRKLLTTLELHDVTLVGFGMGGGEVARYFGRFGSAGIRRAAFISSITPGLCANPENPEGLDVTALHRVQLEIDADRFAFARHFVNETYAGGTSAVSIDRKELDVALAAMASPLAMNGCVAAWCEDFRSDLARIDVPTLVLHGENDRVAPIYATARRMREYLQHSTIIEIEDAPHGLTWTHAARVNAALLAFLR